MYDDYVEATDAFYENCVDGHGQMHPEDEEIYERRLRIQESVAEWLMEHRL
jgi:hypothetical protein